ncbi:hypothetical protein [Halostella pelagica]|uniref:hypothetical protein n=1 Tax=Halostella pelagica TaxID=2583824 RepID=UPI001080B28D|nr:hypothetical protein [Halostella pelagica]
MSDEDRQIRLLLLHEAGGEIEGRGKYHKLLDRYRRGAEDTGVEHVVKERGPYDPGLSRSVQRYLDLELVETDEEGESRDVRETQKGERYMSGYERVRSRLDESFRNTVKQARQVVGEYGEKSMSQLVKEEDVQADKELPYGTRLSDDDSAEEEV